MEKPQFAVAGDREERNFPKEEEETANNNDDEQKCIGSFLLVEDCLNELFDDILKRKLQLHSDVDTLRATLIELIERRDKLAMGLRNKIKSQEYTLAQYEVENSELKREVETLKDQFKKSDSRVYQLMEKLERYQQEKEELLKLKNADTRYESLDSNSFEKVTDNREYDLKSMQIVKTGSGSDEAQLLQWEAGQGHANSKNEKELERKEDEKTTTEHEEDIKKQHQEDIDLIEKFFISSWMEINASLIQEKIIEHFAIKDILFHTLWEAYRFSFDTMFMQLRKFSINFHFPYSSESTEHNGAELELPQDIVQSLREMMSKVKPKDKNSIFREKLMKMHSVKNRNYLNEHPKYISYISDCLHLCHQLIFKSNFLHLKTHNIGTPLDKEFFNSLSGIEQGVVERVIFPALVYFKDNKILTLRKGLVFIRA